jgi:hypothetical protein
MSPPREKGKEKEREKKKIGKKTEFRTMMSSMTLFHFHFPNADLMFPKRLRRFRELTAIGMFFAFKCLIRR